jgi:hypothetical protein
MTMEYDRRTEEEEHFERLCVGVADEEVHEQEAIEFFEQHLGHEKFDAVRWLDVALYFSLDVARGVIDQVSAEDKAASTISEVIADNLDISYEPYECEQFADIIQFAQANGVAVDFDILLSGCQRTLDDMADWASEETMAPVERLRDELNRLKPDAAA